VTGKDVIEIRRPELFYVANEKGIKVYGSNQNWYPKGEFYPKGACGPAVASDILAYILRSRLDLYARAKVSGLDGLAETGANDKAGYIGFMKKVYRYFKPSVIGLHYPWFVKGMARIAEERGLPVSVTRLRVPARRSGRPAFEKAAEYIRSSLAADIPVAFLTVSAGGIENLYTWHWMSVIGLDEDGKRIKTLSNTRMSWADLGSWLDRSRLGGAFVRVEVLDDDR